MILKYKYHCDSGNIIAYQNYTLAQHSNLSNKINILSTDQNADRYDYCLEFVCYNTKNIPKTQYISTILHYGENGIEFDIPNNLTQFRGHTDLQLTGYDKESNNIVFKSIAKNSIAYMVEGSLCVLENSIIDTPNVITEIMNQLEYLRDIKNNLVSEFLASANAEFSAVLSKYTWHVATFWDRDEVVKKCSFIHGYKIPMPNYTIGDDYVINGGWYNCTDNTLWDFENNIIQSDIDLYINYHTIGLEFAGNKVKNYNGTCNKVFIPNFYNGIKIFSTSTEVMTCNIRVRLYLNDFFTECNFCKSNTNIDYIYVPLRNKFISSDGENLMSKDKKVLISCVYKTSTYNLPITCDTINQDAMINLPFINLNLGNNIKVINVLAIKKNNSIRSFVLPANFERASSYAISDCCNLKDIYCLAIKPPAITANSFLISSYDAPTVLKPNIHVLPEVIDSYLQDESWKTYNILAIGGQTYAQMLDVAKNEYQTFCNEKCQENLEACKSYSDSIIDSCATLIENIRNNGGINV